MKFDAFLNQVASEPERTIRRTVRTTPPQVLEQAARPGGMRLTDFLSAPGRQAEQREIRYAHILGAPASPGTVDAWLRQRPSLSLPADLRALLTQVNGIHLWANVETGRSYVGLAPVEEWEIARVKMYGAEADRDLLDDRFVAISYNQDGASFIAIDVVSGEYFLMDTAGPDTTSPIGSSVEDLLEWIWQNRIAPKS